MNEQIFVECESSSGLSSVRAQDLLYIITATVKMEIIRSENLHLHHPLASACISALSSTERRPSEKYISAFIILP